MVMDLATLGLEVRSLNVQVASARLTELARSAARAASAADRFRGSMSSASDRAGRMGNSTRRSASGMDRLNRTFAEGFSITNLFNSAAADLIKTLGAVAVAYTAFSTSSDFTKRGMQFNQEMESARIGMASILASTAQLQDSQGEITDGAKKYAAAQGISRDMMQEIQRLALETTATTRELVAGTQAVIAPAVRYGVELSKIPQLATNIAQAMSAMNIPLVQMRTESEALLSGNINRAQDLLAGNLAITGEMVRSWQQQGTLIEELTKRLQAFRKAGQDVAQTVAGLRANFSEYLDVIAGQSTEGLFSGVKSFYNDLLDTMNRARGSGLKFEPSENIRNIVDELTAAYNALGLTVEHVGEALSAFLKDMNASIGTVDIATETQRIADAIQSLVAVIKTAVVAFVAYKTATWALGTETGKLVLLLITGRASLIDAAAQARAAAAANYQLALSQQAAAQAAWSAAWANTANARSELEAISASTALAAAEAALASANLRVAATAEAAAMANSVLGGAMARGAAVGGAAAAGLRGVLGRVLGFLGGPWVLGLTLAGTAMYVLYDIFSDASDESSRLRSEYDRLAEAAKNGATVSAEEAVARVNASLEYARAALETARNRLDESLKKRRTDPVYYDSWSSTPIPTEQFAEMQTLSERLFGMEDSTKKATEAVKAFFAEMESSRGNIQNQFAALNKLNSAFKDMQGSLNTNAVNYLKELIQEVTEELTRLSDRTTAFDAIANKSAEASGNVQQLSRITAVLNESFQAIGENKIRMPDTSGGIYDLALQAPQAIKFLDDVTKGTDSARLAHFEMQKAAAEAYLKVVEGAASAATAMYLLELQNYQAAASFGPVGEAAANALARAKENADALRGYADTMTTRVGEMKPPRLDSNRRNKTEEQQARYRIAAASKILELELELAKVSEEVVGIETSELRILELQQAHVQDLARLREQAARAGIKGEDAQLKRAEELSNAIYKQREEWEKISGPIRQIEAVFEALGDESGIANAKMDMLNAKIAHVTETMKDLAARKDALSGLGQDTAESSKEFATLNMRLSSTQSQLQVLTAEKYALAYASRFSQGAAREEYEANKALYDGMAELIQRNNELVRARNDLDGELGGNARSLTADMEALNTAYNDHSISQDTYLSKMIQARAEWVKLQSMKGEEISFADNMVSIFAKVTEGFTTMENGIRDAWGNFCADFVDGFSTAVGRAIFYSEDLGEALNNLYKQIASDLVSALVKLGIQWLVMQAMSQTIGASSSATAAAQALATGAAIAAAYAPAAEAVSLATSGGNAAGAVAGMEAASVAMQLQVLSGFKTGGYTGNMSPNAVAGIVHGGEYVMDAQTVKRYGTGFFDSLRLGSGSTPPTGVAPALPGGNQGGGGVFIVNINNSASDQVQTETQESMGDDGVPRLDVLVSLVESKMSERMYRGNSVLGKAIDQTRGTNRDKSLYK